ncbi:MAG: PIN domain nuclease [Pseudomonadota bacterium]
MIVVDSLVWIDYFSGTDSPETDKLDGLLGREPIGTSELIYADVLQGFRKDQDFEVAQKLFALLTELEMVNAKMAIKSAEYSRYLRGMGISVRDTIETLIATYCIEKRMPLLYRSPNFQHFENHLHLRNAMRLKSKSSRDSAAVAQSA